jgi:predicted sulfurtransferase
MYARKAGAIAASIFLAATPIPSPSTAQAPGFASERAVAGSTDNVTIVEPVHIEAADLATALSSPGARVILLDVRSEHEFTISRLKNAIRVEPDMEPVAIVERLAPSLLGSSVVAYCTAGGRSASLAVNVGSALTRAGAREVLVLRGGIIEWVNRGFPVVDDRGPTKLVHTFDEDMSKQLREPGNARY